VYFDGVVRCELPLTQDVVYDSSEALWVARHGAGSTTYDFDGNLDEVRIYDRVLTAAEIADLAAGGN
jgi:hypothetical protein